MRREVECKSGVASTEPGYKRHAVDGGLVGVVVRAFGKILVERRTLEWKRGLCKHFCSRRRLRCVRALSMNLERLNLDVR